MRIYTKSVRSMTEEEFLAAYELNLGYAGLMRNELEYARKSLTKTNARAVMAYEDNRLIGWALKFNKRPGEPHMYIYVDSAHRGKGIGRALSGRALVGMRKPIKVYPTPSARKVYAPLRARNRVVYMPGQWHS